MKGTKKSKSMMFGLLGLLGMLMIFSFGCKDEDGGTTILVDRNVTVPGSGGGVEVIFTAANGDRIRITLTATDTSMEPYGHLQYPDGSSGYYPPINTAANGQNSVELSLNQTGGYILTVFDGSNQGGQVQVKIERLP